MISVAATRKEWFVVADALDRVMDEFGIRPDYEENILVLHRFRKRLDERWDEILLGCEAEPKDKRRPSYRG